eukprot:7011907-Prymnesium_polylepis.1
MQSAAGGDEHDELEAELTRTQWAYTIWDLAMIVFVAHPAVLTERLVPWWQLHLRHPQEEEEEEELCNAEQPGEQVGRSACQPGSEPARPCLASFTRHTQRRKWGSIVVIAGEFPPVAERAPRPPPPPTLRSPTSGRCCASWSCTGCRSLPCACCSACAARR